MSVRSVRYHASSSCSFRVLPEGMVEGTPAGRSPCAISLDAWRLLSEFMISRTVFADATDLGAE